MKELEQNPSTLDKQNPLISVIVPVYNIIEYLERCVSSVLNQTYKNIEILLVDDGSTDGTDILCDKLGEQNNNIRVFHKENGGSSSARNLGIEKANGEYLGFVDSDDYIEPEMYELLMQALVKYQVNIAQAARDEISEDGSKRSDVCVPPHEDTLYEDAQFMKELLLHKGDCSFCTKLIKKELFLNKKFPEGVLNEDFYLLVHMLIENESIISIPQTGYHVFYKSDSNTRKSDPENFSRIFRDIIDNADMVSDLVNRFYPELIPLSIRFGLFQRLDYMLHIPISKMNFKNLFYRNQVLYLRRHLWDSITSNYLTRKNKCYLLLLSLAPKTVRKVHQMLKKG